MVVEERVARLQNKCRGVALVSTTPWVSGESLWDASERTREHLVAVVRTPRDAIYTSGLRGSSAHLSASRATTRDSALFALAARFPIPSNHALPRGFPRSSQVPPLPSSSERFDSPRAILLPKKLDQPRAIPLLPKRPYSRTFSIAIRKQILSSLSSFYEGTTVIYDSLSPLNHFLSDRSYF